MHHPLSAAGASDADRLNCMNICMHASFSFACSYLVIKNTMTKNAETSFEFLHVVRCMALLTCGGLRSCIVAARTALQTRWMTVRWIVLKLQGWTAAYQPYQEASHPAAVLLS